MDARSLDLAMDRLVVTVPSSTTHEKHVSYSISVRKGDTAWAVRRRYQDFEKLHAAVRRCGAALRTSRRARAQHTSRRRMW